MKRLLILCSLCLASLYSVGQTSTISGQIQDPNGQTFNNGTCTIQFVPTPGATGPFLLNGSTFNQQPSCSFDGLGNISATVSRNDQISPSGSKWQFIVQPNASSQGTTVNISIAAASVNIAAVVNAQVPVITVFAGHQTPFAYQDNEVVATPSPGQDYWNVTNSLLRLWTGSAWVSTVSSGTGTNNTIPKYTSPTGLGNSSVTDDGTTVNTPENVTIGGTLRVTNNVTVSNVDGFIYVDGNKYPTVQAAITAACGLSPVPPVIVPPGTFASPNAQFTICDHLYLTGAGRATSDNTTCPTTITTTQTSGDLFNVTAFDHVHIEKMCIKNTGTGGGTPIHCVGCRFSMFNDLYIQGPWANGIIVSPNVGVVSAIWNTFRNIHHTGYQTSAAMVTLDALNTTSQVLNNNRFELMTGNGGATGFGLKIKATGGTCPGGAVFINENYFSGGQDSTSFGGGTGISADNCTFRDLWMDTQTIEGNNLSISLGTGNAGLTCLACEISANTTNTPTDNTGISGRTFITGNIGGAGQIWGVDATGAQHVYALCLQTATCSTNTINGAAGMIVQAASNAALTINATSIGIGQQIILNGNTFSNGGGTQTMPSATGTLALFNNVQTWTANQTNMPLITPTIGGGSTINGVFNGSATLTYGSITAQNCAEQTVSITGVTTTNFGVSCSPRTTLGSTNLSWSSWVSSSNNVSVRVCNPSTGNITPNAVVWGCNEQQ